MFELNSLASDPKLEEEGVWRPLGSGAEALVARIGNKKYRSMIRRKLKANRVILEQEDDLAEEIGEEVMNEVYAHTILLDLKNVSIDGKPLEKYTPAIGIRLLAMRDFRERIKAYAEDAEAYRTKRDEEVGKS